MKYIKILSLIVILFAVGCKDYRELHQSAAGSKVGKGEPLTYDEMCPIIVEAKIRWQKALDGEELPPLRFVIVTFDDDSLSIGRSMGGSKILIEGYLNWFIDKTPECDEEFEEFSFLPHFLKASEGDVSEKYDLLTVIMHEIGHKLNLDDNHNSASLMNYAIGEGIRRLP